MVLGSRLFYLGKLQYIRWSYFVRTIALINDSQVIASSAYRFRTAGRAVGLRLDASTKRAQ
jgi:hypothetical protein